MGIKFNHTPQRIEDFQYELRAIGRRAVNLYPVMDKIADKLLFREGRMFETRGATSGVYWSPLKKSTVERKTRAGVADPFAPLRRSDKLMKSLSVRGAEYQVLEIDDDSVYLSTELPYAEIHAAGNLPRMPARPPLIVPKSHAHEYIKMIRDDIFEGDS